VSSAPPLDVVGCDGSRSPSVVSLKTQTASACHPRAGAVYLCLETAVEPVGNPIEPQRWIALKSWSAATQKMPPAGPGRHAAASGSEIKRKKSLPSGLDRPDIRPCAVIVTLRLAPLNMRIASRSATSRSAKALFELSSGIAASTMSDSWASSSVFPTANNVRSNCSEVERARR
jgi:hypothetical protein